MNEECAELGRDSSSIPPRPPTACDSRSPSILAQGEPLPQRGPRSSSGPVASRFWSPGPGVVGGPLPSPELQLKGAASKRRLLMSSSDERKPDASASARIGAREPPKTIISDDSELECTNLTGTGRFGPASFSVTTRRCLTGSRPSSHKKKKRGKFEFSPDLSFDDLPDVDMNVLSTVDLGGAAIQWLEEIDALRRKTSNLQGRVSGQMRDRVRRAVRMSSVPWLQGLRRKAILFSLGIKTLPYPTIFMRRKRKIKIFGKK